MDWRVVFEEDIFVAAESNISNYSVQDLHISNDYIMATVFENEKFDVIIDFEENSVLEMKCTCLYPKDRKNCKDIAAVMLAYA